MTGWGHLRPNWAISAMSGLPPLATELRTFSGGPVVYNDWFLGRAFTQMLMLSYSGFELGSITRSARATSAGLSSMPRVLAVFGMSQCQ